MGETIKFSREEMIRSEIRNFMKEGLQDVYAGRLLDFDATFDELEERYETK